MKALQFRVFLSGLISLLLIGFACTVAGGQDTAKDTEQRSRLASLIQKGDWKGAKVAAESWEKADPKAAVALFVEDAAGVMTKARTHPIRSTADFPYSDEATCDKLLAWTQDLLVQDPKNTNYLMLNGIFYVTGRRDFARSMEQFEKILASEPDNVVALGLVGAGYGAKNQLDDAVRVSQKALKLDPDSAQANDNLGMASMTRGDRDKAEEYFKKAVACSDAGAMDWFNLGSLYFAQRRLQDAKTALLKAVEVSPNFYPPHWNLASVYYSLGMTEDCIRECKIVVKLAPNSVEGQKAANNLRLMGR